MLPAFRLFLFHLAERKRLTRMARDLMRRTGKQHNYYSPPAAWYPLKR